MNTNGIPDGAIDLEVFRRNRDSYPQNQLQPYWGKLVAWSADGTRIVAAGDTDADVDRQLDALGIRYDQVVYGYVDDPAVGNLG